MLSGTPELPAATWLGRPLDLTSITPRDMKTVLSGVNMAYKFVKTSGASRDVAVDGTTFAVPESVEVMPLQGDASPSYLCYSNDYIARSMFKSNPRLQAQHFAICGTPSMSYCIDKIFRPNMEYALYSLNCDVYRASLRTDITEYLDGDKLVRVVEHLPTVFDSNDAEVVSSFRGFFNAVGSHVITAATYGARYTLTCSSTNTSLFSACVCSEFNGIPSGGKFDAALKNQQTYRNFLNSSMSSITCMGGNPAAASAVTAHQEDYSYYDTWTRTVNEQGRAALTGFVVTDLWTLMRAAGREELRGRADALQKGFAWIMEHPRICRTRCMFNVSSDWGTLFFWGTGSTASVAADGDLPADTTVADMSVRWGKQMRGDVQVVAIPFSLYYDGSPVDFLIEHGSYGTSGPGQAQLTMDGMTFINDKVTDNKTNTMYFFNAPTSIVPI